jgi:hypothetical protein
MSRAIEGGGTVRVELARLEPNPLRNFDIDPIVPERVDMIKKSINDDGFWGGVVCRETPEGRIQVIAGAHRVAGALAAGVTTADLFVMRDMDDDKANRIYTAENATQRGNHGTALVGSVASAICAIVKKMVTPTSGDATTRSASTREGLLMSERGIGWKPIAEYYQGVPGMGENNIRQALDALKESGQYAKIIESVRQEIERERLAAEAEVGRLERERLAAEEAGRKAEATRKAMEQARAKEEADAKTKAKEKADRAVSAAEKHTRDFDLEGVSKYITTAAHIDTFRECVTGAGIKPYLPVEGQAKLARHLVEKAGGMKVEFTSAFIRENIMVLVLDAKTYQRARTKEQQEDLERQSRIKRAERHQEDFARACRSLISAGTDIAEDVKNWPEGEPFPVIAGLRRVLGIAKKVIDHLYARV